MSLINVEITDSEKLRSQIEEILSREGMTATKVASGCGLSQTTFSQWRAGEYTGRIDRVEKAVEAFLARDKEKNEEVSHDYNIVMTFNVQKVLTTAARTHQYCELAVIYGDAGLGKTTGITEYAIQNPGTIIIPAKYGYSKTELFRAIAAKLGLENTSNFIKLYNVLLKKLKGTGKLIIIDEADYVTPDGLDSLRHLHDESGNTFGVLLVGLPRLYTNIQGHKKHFKQFYSRLDTKLEVESLSHYDFELIIKENLPEAIEYSKLMHSLCNASARSLQKLIKNIHRILDARKTNLTKTIINEAHKMIVT